MPRLLTTGQAATICSVTPDTVLKWIRSGHLRAHRTAGGHHRINLEDLKPFTVVEAPSDDAAAPLPGRRQYRYCWEYNGNGNLLQACEGCAVFLMRAQRCYEVAKLAPQVAHAGTFCKGSCEDCEYYRAVHGQNTNVLVLTKDPVLERDLRADAGGAGFNLAITDCEYNCSAIINNFKPDFVIVDCFLGRQASRDISNHVMQDPRIPWARVVLAGGERDLPSECDREIFARIERPFTISDIREFIGGTGSSCAVEKNRLV